MSSKVDGIKSASEFVYIPIPRKLYHDIVRFSDGEIDPARLAVDQIEDWLYCSVAFDNFDWDDRWEEVAEEYAPDVYKAWLKEQAKAVPAKPKSRDLVWKEVTIPHGSEVRMIYKGRVHYAKVQDGAIVDDEGNRYSPSRWARHVANDTARNAWRDLSFKEPLSKHWIPAEVLRMQARKELGLG